MLDTPAATHEAENVPASRLPDPEERPLLTVDEAVPFLRLDRKSIYAAIKRGDLPSVVIGRRVFLPTAGIRTRVGLDSSAA